jgi:uncharacterized protein (DUF952 family)
MLYHLTTPGEWDLAVARGAHRPDSLVAVGFVHLSAARQLLFAADEHYRGREDLVALAIDEQHLPPGALVLEAGSPPHGDELFPHLHAPLPVAAVVAVVPMPCGSDGSFRWPPGLPRPGGEG